MIRFVLRKMLNMKWMVLSLFIGNLLLMSIAASSPMYAQAVLQRMLTRDLGNYLLETNQYPGDVSIQGYFNLAVTDEQDFNKMEQAGALMESLPQEMGVESRALVTHYYLDYITAYREVSVEGQKAKVTLTLDFYSDVQEHINVINGSMYSGQLAEGNTIEVIVNEKTFVEKNLMLGERMELNLKNADSEPYYMQVVGIYENNSEEDPYWESSPAFWNGVCLMDEELFRQLFLHQQKDGLGLHTQVYTMLDYQQMRSDSVDGMLQTLEEYENSASVLGFKDFSARFEPTLTAFIPKAQKLDTTIWVLQAPIFVLLAAFIFMVSRQMLEMEQNEMSVLKSRGASKRHIVLLYLLQSVIIALFGLLGGIPVGMLICRVLGASNSFLEFVNRSALPVEVGPMAWLFAGTAALFSVGAMVLPVFRYAKVTIVSHKRQKSRKHSRPWWQKVFLDVILLAVSLYGWYQFNSSKEYLAQRVMDGGVLDPLLYFCSSLFMIGAGLFFLRVFPLLIRLVFQMGKKWWSPSLYASFSRILRNQNHGFIMVFMVLTVSMGIFSSQAARTINANEEEKIRYATGADVVIQEAWENNADTVEGSDPGAVELTYYEPDFDKYQELEGVEHAAKVLVNNRVSVSMDGGRVSNVRLMGIDTKDFGKTAWFKDGLLPSHWYQYLNAISQNSRAVLVSSNFQRLYGYKVGDIITYSNENGKLIRGVIYGFVDYWPSYAPVTRVRSNDGVYKDSDQFLIVAHLAQIQSTWGVTPYQVWIKTKGSSQFLYDYAQENRMSFLQFDDTAAKLIELKNDPVFQGTNGILTVGFIVVLVLCATGFLIYWILSIRSRTLQFGIFRAMGMSMGEVLSMLSNEQVFISGASIGAGILVGKLASSLFIPLIQIAYSASDQVLPLQIISEGSDYARLFLVIGVMMALCMGILGALISKIKIAQALKLGED